MIEVTARPDYWLAGRKSVRELKCVLSTTEVSRADCTRICYMKQRHMEVKGTAKIPKSAQWPMGPVERMSLGLARVSSNEEIYNHKDSSTQHIRLQVMLIGFICLQTLVLCIITHFQISCPQSLGFLMYCFLFLLLRLYLAHLKKKSIKIIVNLFLKM